MNNIFETIYGNIEVLQEVEPKYNEWRGIKKKITMVEFKCHCGSTYTGRLADIKRGKLKSCGCSSIKRKEFFLNSNYRHGKSHSNIERVWIGLNQRCNNENGKSYKDYGGRGIKCEWNSFKEFYEDMGDTYKEGLSIDRIDVNLNYSKDNCKWSNDYEQANNRRNNVYIEINGITKTMQEWCRELGISYTMVRRRIQKGMDKIEAILTPNKRLNGNTLNSSN